MKKLLTALAVLAALTGCSRDADVASRNLSQAADNFEIARRVIFYNGITGEYMLTIEGFCSINPEQKKLSVVCKVGPGAYKKHFLGLSDNVTFFVEQLEQKNVSTNFYRVVFKPKSIIPDVEVK